MSNIDSIHEYFLMIYMLSALFVITVKKDPYPQWRQLAWSPDCTMLAYADSSGQVTVFDLMGSLLFTIEEVNTKIDLGLQNNLLVF